MLDIGDFRTFRFFLTTRQQQQQQHYARQQHQQQQDLRVRAKHLFMYLNHRKEVKTNRVGGWATAAHRLARSTAAGRHTHTSLD